MTSDETSARAEAADASAEEAATTDTGRRGLSRRGLFGLAGATAGGIAVGAGAAVGVTAAVAQSAGARIYPFFGRNQSGITTPAQDRLHFAAFDLAKDLDRDELIELLQDWTYAASRLTQGLDVSEDGSVDGGPLAPPDDTGEAQGLAAGGLTITFGFGPGIFVAKDGSDRFGVASRRPEALVELPHFSGDTLDETISGGDLCIQACADDPQVAVHAIRNLSRIAFGRASIRWSQLGFGRTSSTSASQATPRNLFGFKDGTANVKSEDSAGVADHVWVADSDGSDWMVGGSYLVTRKIRMIIETWDRSALGEQERVIGRTKGEGAPLSGGAEFTEPDFAQKVDGATAIDKDAHVRLAHPDFNDGAKLLRRGYNFVEGNDELGRLNAGLFFIAYQRDPRKQFVPIQKQLARNDLLNEYIRHIGSGIFAIPPGAAKGSYVGASLFE